MKGYGELELNDIWVVPGRQKITKHIGCLMCEEGVECGLITSTY